MRRMILATIVTTLTLATAAALLPPDTKGAAAPVQQREYAIRSVLPLSGAPSRISVHTDASGTWGFVLCETWAGPLLFRYWADPLGGAGGDAPREPLAVYVPPPHQLDIRSIRHEPATRLMTVRHLNDGEPHIHTLKWTGSAFVVEWQDVWVIGQVGSTQIGLKRGPDPYYDYKTTVLAQRVVNSWVTLNDTWIGVDQHAQVSDAGHVLTSASIYNGGGPYPLRLRASDGASLDVGIPYAGLLQHHTVSAAGQFRWYRPPPPNTGFVCPWGVWSYGAANEGCLGHGPSAYVVLAVNRNGIAVGRPNYWRRAAFDLITDSELADFGRMVGPGVALDPLYAAIDDAGHVAWCGRDDLGRDWLYVFEPVAWD